MGKSSPWSWARVDRFAEYVDHATEHAVAYVDRGDLACALDGHVFSNVVDFVEEDDTHIAFLKVEGYTFHSVFKFYKLVGADIVETVDVGYSVAYFQNNSCLFERHFGADVLQLLF